MKQRLVTCLIFSAILFGCEKTEHYYLPQQIKDWGYFKEGSYWIYQNTSNGILDSIYVTSTKEYLDSNEADKRVTRISEAIDVSFESAKNIDYKVTLYSYKTNSIIVDQNDDQYKIKSHFILLSLNSKNELSNEDPLYEIIEKKDNLIVDGINYTDVIHIKATVENQYFSPQFSLDYSSNEYWISKHYWIIKKIINNSRINEEWLLIHSNIKQ